MTRRPKNRSSSNRIHQTIEQETFMSLLRTADFLLRGVEETLQPAHLTPTQYNVLRMLRGAGAAGLSCRQIAERMLTRDPDITRLLDRLEARRLVIRTRERGDRRVITARITPAGLKTLRSLDDPLAKLHRRQLGRLGSRGLQTLTRLLAGVRRG